MKIDCAHPKTFHPHGTRNAYALDRCRCDECTGANRAYERQRKRDRLYGRPGGYVDADPVREHIARLSAAGMGWKRVAAAAEVATGTMYPILYGRGGSNPAEHRPPRKRVRRDIADRILAVRLELAPHAPVPSVGTVRRLQALVAVGWSLTRLAPRLGMLPSNLHSLVHTRDQVLQATADSVAALYDEFWDQPPPHAAHHDLIAYRRALRYAADRGWLPPLAWDDEAIDDPDARPATVDADNEPIVDHVVIQLALEGRRVKASKAEKLIIVDRWRKAGRTLVELERIQGWRAARYSATEAAS